MTREEADKVLSQLRVIRDGAEADMRLHWYAPFSGQPDADIGALNMTYNDSVLALQNTEDAVVDGTYDEARWLQLSDLAEKSMRSIQGYAGEVTASSEVDFVASETGKTVGTAASQVAGATLKGVGSFALGIVKAAPLLILGIALFLVWYFRASIRRLTGK